MKRFIMIIVCSFVSTAMLLAQGAGTAASNGGSGESVTGCLAKGAAGHDFMLTNARHPKGVAVTSKQDLSAGIGHIVTLAGSWGVFPTTNAGGKMSIGANGQVTMTNMSQVFTATKVIRVGNACTAGGTVTKAPEKPAASQTPAGRTPAATTAKAGTVSTGTVKTTSAAASKPPAPKTTAAAQWITTGTGLKYRDVVVGKGPQPKPGDDILVNYTGRFTNGKVFDSSLSPGRTPFRLHLGRGEVIPGWDQGLATMRVGESAS